MKESEKQESAPSTNARARYERPAIEESATFERLQLSCAHQAGETAECDVAAKS